MRISPSGPAAAPNGWCPLFMALGYGMRFEDELAGDFRVGKIHGEGSAVLRPRNARKARKGLLNFNCLCISSTEIAFTHVEFCLSFSAISVFAYHPSYRLVVSSGASSDSPSAFDHAASFLLNEPTADVGWVTAENPRSPLENLRPEISDEAVVPH